MVAIYIGHLQAALSEARLEGYRPSGGSDLDMAVNYFWNIQLSEALYPCFRTLEIALRNSFHQAATVRYGTELWFDLPRTLQPRQTEAVAQARATLTRHNKPHTPGRIVRTQFRLLDYASLRPVSQFILDAEQS